MEIDIRDNHQRSRNALLFLWLSIIVIGLGIFADIFCYIDTNGGSLIMEDTILASQVSVSLRAILAFTKVPVYILSIVFFIMWFRRAYYNLHQLSRFNLRYGEGWAAGAWFTPIMNLFAPYRIMKEIAEDTKEYMASINDVFESTYKDLSAYISAWWTLWIMSNVIINYLTRKNFTASISAEIAQIPVEAIGHTLHIIAGVILIYIVKQSQLVQNDLYEMRELVEKEVRSRIEAESAS